MYSNYCRHSLLCTKILCVCVRVCNELSMSINMVQRSLHKQKKNYIYIKKKKKANRLVTRIHTDSLFSPNRYSNKHSWFPDVVPTGVCNVVLISFLYLRNIQEWDSQTALSIRLMINNFPHRDIRPFILSVSSMVSEEDPLWFLLCYNYRWVVISVFTGFVLILFKRTIVPFVKARLLGLTPLRQTKRVRCLFCRRGAKYPPCVMRLFWCIMG